jgi:hypothetical protein
MFAARYNFEAIVRRLPWSELGGALESSGVATDVD